MLQFGPLVGGQLIVQHQHADGTWANMEADDGGHHDPAQHDPEREWQKGHVYICRRCAERVKVMIADEQDTSGEMPEAATA
jgi:hypothetical protein